MKRRMIAAAWVLGATVPLLMATLFFAGCCVLPFHGAIHKVIPMCELAMSVARGSVQHEHDATPPAGKKNEPVKRIVTQVSRPFRLAAVSATPAPLTPGVATSYRSFISLGAMRCDQDVGLLPLVATFRI